MAHAIHNLQIASMLPDDIVKTEDFTLAISGMSPYLSTAAIRVKALGRYAAFHFALTLSAGVPHERSIPSLPLVTVPQAILHQGEVRACRGVHSAIEGDLQVCGGLRKAVRSGVCSPGPSEVVH